MNFKIAAPFFFCRKQEEIDAICAFTTAPEGIQGIHSKFRINRTFGSKMCEVEFSAPLGEQKVLMWQFYQNRGG